MAARGLDKKDIYGLELSEQQTEALKLRGYNAFCERVETTNSIPTEGIDLITMFHVIEHVADPLDVMTKIFSWLRPGGFLVVETPNTDSLDFRLFSKRLLGWLPYPETLVLVRSKKPYRFGARARFNTISMKYQTGHSFWMYSFHHLLAYGGRGKFKYFSRLLFDPLKSLFLLISFLRPLT